MSQRTPTHQRTASAGGDGDATALPPRPSFVSFLTVHYLFVLFGRAVGGVLVVTVFLLTHFLWCLCVWVCVFIFLRVVCLGCASVNNRRGQYSALLSSTCTPVLKTLFLVFVVCLLCMLRFVLVASHSSLFIHISAQQLKWKSLDARVLRDKRRVISTVGQNRTGSGAHVAEYVTSLSFCSDVLVYTMYRSNLITFGLVLCTPFNCLPSLLLCLLLPPGVF